MKLTFLHLDSLGFEKLTQFLDLLLELSNEFRVRVLVNNGFADNLFGAVSVPGEWGEFHSVIHSRVVAIKNAYLKVLSVSS